MKITLDFLKENWHPQVGNKKAEMSVWDLSAQRYREMPLPTIETSKSLRIVTEKKMFSSESSILDVGCGAGRFTIAFANQCKYAAGSDLSQQMINYAVERAEKNDIKNAEFFCENWHDLDLKEHGWEHKFDLVFANMTPAVQSAKTFEMLSSASREWCFMSKPTRWTNSMTYNIVKELGFFEEYRTFDIDMMYAYDTLCLLGKTPLVDYDYDTWNWEGTPEEACERTIPRIDMKFALSEAQKAKAKEFIYSTAIDGKIYDKTDVTISMLYWHI